MVNHHYSKTTNSPTVLNVLSHNLGGTCKKWRKTPTMEVRPVLGFEIQDEKCVTQHVHPSKPSALEPQDDGPAILCVW